MKNVRQTNKPKTQKILFRLLTVSVITGLVATSCIPLEEELFAETSATNTEIPSPAEIDGLPETNVLTTQEAPLSPETSSQQNTIFTVEDEKFPHVVEADWYLYTGQYDQAEVVFQTQYDQPESNPELKASALLGLGRIALLTAQETRAVELFDTILQVYPASAAAIDARFFLGEAYSGLGEYVAAALAYQQFANLAPQTLPAFVWEKIGDAYQLAGQFNEAVNAYQSTINALTDTHSINLIKEKIGILYRDQGETDIAVQYFLDAFNNSENDYFRARMNFLVGQAYMAAGQTALAYQKFQENVSAYPYVYDTYTGLITLVEAGESVNEYQRGLTDYYARAYGVAVDAFNRYIDNTPVPERNGDVHHYKAFSLLALEDYQGAIAEWRVLIENFPTNQFFASAWDEIAYTQWMFLNNPKTAAQTYLTFCDTYPSNPEVPDFLFYAARVYELHDLLPEAAETWQRLAYGYPDSTNAVRALHLAGVSYYRLADYQNAMTVFTQMQNAAVLSDDQAAARFWQGKTFAAQGQISEAEAAYAAAVLLSPGSYYGIRAEEILTNQTPFAPSDTIQLAADLQSERKQAVIWMRTTFNIDPATDLQSPQIISNDPDYIRAIDYWRLGYYHESLASFDIVRGRYESDPINLFRLLAVLVNHGFYRAAAFASRQILDLSNIGTANLLTAPAYFNHIRYGVFYNDIIEEQSARYAIDPLLIYTQIRQESLFESRVGSSAGAIGLMQIIPSTGAQIHQQLNFPPNYTSDMLYLPAVNLPMGVYYIDLQRDYFDGAFHPALAAYNAGPGNAAIWWSQAQGDPDLFLEIIRFGETRTYLVNIVETRHIYQILYQNATE
ncbi:MAG: tetratricopeptide repeat protein [Anaerolineae bacterium]|nr:tetratricopeptide repeat protein [Anaerolineae bacterium]